MAEYHRADSLLSRCALDTAEWGKTAGVLHVRDKSSSSMGTGRTAMCLTALTNGATMAMPCTGTATQVWEVLHIGGAAGSRLRNKVSGGCMRVTYKCTKVPAGPDGYPCTEVAEEQHKLRHDG